MLISFLDLIIKDYETFHQEIEELTARKSSFEKAIRRTSKRQPVQHNLQVQQILIF